MDGGEASLGDGKAGGPAPMSAALIFLTVFAVLGGFLFGYDTGVVSGAEVFIERDLGLRSSQVEVVVSITVLFAAIGSAASGPPMQARGRRPIIMVASGFYCVGSCVIALAPGLVVLVVGRALLGLGVGLSSMAIPVYVAEVAPPEIRGRLVSCYNLFIVLGQAVACGVNVWCAARLGVGARWRASMGAAAVPAFVQLCGFLFLPESPRWLAQRGDRAGAIGVLRRLRGPGATEAQVDADLASVNAMAPEDVGDARATVLEVARSPHLRAIFGVGLGLMALQQLSGINTVMYYGASIMIMCGFEESQSVQLAAALAAAQGLGIVVSIPLFDRLGRRNLLVPSAVASATCMLVVAAAFARGISDGADRLAALGGVVLYLVAFGVGLSSGPWVVNAEIYPTRVRGVGNSAACTVNWLANYVVSATFLTATRVCGKAATFALLAFVGYAGALWVHRTLPETAGKSLEDIEDVFRARCGGDAAADDDSDHHHHRPSRAPVPHEDPDAAPADDAAAAEMPLV